MISMNATTARKNLYRLISDVNENCVPVTITNANGKNAVLLSEADWNALQETIYLYSVPGLVPSILAAKDAPIGECEPFDEDEEW